MAREAEGSRGGEQDVLSAETGGDTTPVPVEDNARAVEDVEESSSDLMEPEWSKLGKNGVICNRHTRTIRNSKTEYFTFCHRHPLWGEHYACITSDPCVIFRR